MLSKMMTLLVGRPMGITPYHEGYMPVLNGPSFDIIAFYSNLSERHIQDWLTGALGYGVFVKDSIPIFLLDIGTTWSLNVHINIRLESEEVRSAFFEGDPDLTNVILTLASYPDAVVLPSERSRSIPGRWPTSRRPVFPSSRGIARLRSAPGP